MTFRDRVYQMIDTAWSNLASSNGASDETLSSIHAAAADVADAVANDVHSGLVDKVGTTSQALQSLAAAFQSWQPSPGDGGAALKVAVSGAASQLASASAQLSAAVGAYS